MMLVVVQFNVQGTVQPMQALARCEQLASKTRNDVADAGLCAKLTHQVTRGSRESSPQLLPLRGNSNGAVVGVTHASHDAACGNHGHSAKAKLVPSQSCRHEHISAASHATVNPKGHPVSQLIGDQSLQKQDGESEPQPAKWLQWLGLSDTCTHSGITPKIVNALAIRIRKMLFQVWGKGYQGTPVMTTCNACNHAEIRSTTVPLQIWSCISARP